MGFLTLGRRFLNNRNDIIDDRIDVIFRGTQGLTVTCARCHDHKFDPIPTADYYSLYGVLDASAEKAVPLAAPSQEYSDGLKRREAELAAEIADRRAAFTKSCCGLIRRTTCWPIFSRTLSRKRQGERVRRKPGFRQLCWLVGRII